MMKTLTFTKPNNLSQLHDEILTALPALQPASGVPVIRVEGRGEQIALYVPDNADEAAIAAVVAAHVARPQPTAPNFRALMNVVETKIDALDGATTAVQVRQAVKEVLIAQRDFLKARAGL